MMNYLGKKMNIRNIIIVVGESMGLQLTDVKINDIVKTLEDKINIEDKWFLKFGGIYKKVCKTHGDISKEISNNNDMCPKCNVKLIKIKKDDLEKQNTKLYILSDIEKKFVELCENETYKKSLSAGKKAYLTKLYKKMGKKNK